MHGLSVVDEIALGTDNSDPLDDPDAAVDGAVDCAVAGRMVLESIAATKYSKDSPLCAACKLQQACWTIAEKKAYTNKMLRSRR